MPGPSLSASRTAASAVLAVAAWLMATPVLAGSLPDWLQSQRNVPTPPHEASTNAVLIYASTTLTVQGNGQLKRLDRRAYRILRPDGQSRGTLRVPFDSQSRITDLHGWGIPADGRIYEVSLRDALESAVLGVEEGYLMSDVLTKTLQIPAAAPGNLIGYELEQELHPYVAGDEWDIQDTVPVVENHYTLVLPPGWGYQVAWINAAGTTPAVTGPSQWTWTLNSLDPVKEEASMPPWRGVAARMVVSLTAPGGQDRGLHSWPALGAWYWNLARDRRTATPELQRKVQALTAAIPTPLGKLQALAAFVQSDIRYVGIELGIGGHQPHPAADVLAHGYGDCKDKATLLAVMLREIGLDSYAIVINTTRGSVTSGTPPNLDFNHMILAIALPESLTDASLKAVVRHPKLGRLLFFDPTDNLTPLGSLGGGLQANYGLLVAPEDGQLVELPQLSSEGNGVRRSARMTLDRDGTLRGDIQEVWMGDGAAQQRYALRATTRDTDRIKVAEAAAAESLATFHFTKAAIANLREASQPFEWRYTLEAPNYAKLSGGLLLVRPRILGSQSSALLETEEPRHQPIEFPGPEVDTDTVDIAIPAGYDADDLPAPVQADYDFASYHSETTVADHVLHYTRRFEIKQLSVPVNRSADLKALYRIIYNDEKRLAVLAPTGS